MLFKVFLLLLLLLLYFGLTLKSMTAPIFDWSFFTPLGTVIEGHALRPCHEVDIEWPKGGAIAIE